MRWIAQETALCMSSPLESRDSIPSCSSSRIVAPGRNEAVLNDLKARFGARVQTITLSGNEDDDRERMKKAAPVESIA